MPPQGHPRPLAAKKADYLCAVHNAHGYRRKGAGEISNGDLSEKGTFSSFLSKDFLVMWSSSAIGCPTHPTNANCCIFPCIMSTYVLGPNFQGKNSFILIFQFNFFMYLYLDACFLYYKGILAFIFDHIMIQEILCNK